MDNKSSLILLKSSLFLSSTFLLVSSFLPTSFLIRFVSYLYEAIVRVFFCFVFFLPFDSYCCLFVFCVNAPTSSLCVSSQSFMAVGIHNALFPAALCCLPPLVKCRCTDPGLSELPTWYLSLMHTKGSTIQSLVYSGRSSGRAF